MKSRGKKRLPITEEYRALAENSPDIIDRFDRTFHHLYTNPAGLKLLGKPADKIIGKTIRQTGVPEPFCKQWEDRITSVFKTAQPLDVTDAFPGPEGMRSYESRCVPEFDTKGKVQYVLVISRDITGRKNTEQELLQSEADLAEAQRVANIGNWSFDIATKKTRWSAEMYRIFDVDEHTEKSLYVLFHERIHPKDLARVKKTNAKVIASGKAFEIDYRIIINSGEVRTMREIINAKKSATGKVLGLFGTTQDVTKLRKADDVLRRSHHELERLVKERTAKLRTLATELTQAEHRERRRIAFILHEDLQQQLVGIRFRLDMMKQNKLDEASLRDAAWLSDHLHKAIELTRSLTHRLRPPVLYELGLRAALDWLAEDMKQNMGMHVSITGKEPPRLRPDELSAFAFSAVSELLINVGKHSGTKKARVRLQGAGKDHFSVIVSDQGVGYDINRHSHETPFGIFSIRERAVALGGGVMISSAPNQGTTITLTLPIDSST